MKFVDRELLSQAQSCATVERSFELEVRHVWEKRRANLASSEAGQLAGFNDMVPPKDPYIKVRVLDEIGNVVLNDQSAYLACHAILFLRRTDAEHRA